MENVIGSGIIRNLWREEKNTLNRCGKLEVGIGMIFYGGNGKLRSFSGLSTPWGSNFTISKLEVCGYSITQEFKTDGYNKGIQDLQRRSNTKE